MMVEFPSLARLTTVDRSSSERHPAAKTVLVAVKVGDRFFRVFPTVEAVATIPVDEPQTLYLASEGCDLLGPGLDDRFRGGLQLFASSFELFLALHSIVERLYALNGTLGKVAHERKGVECLFVGEDSLSIEHGAGA